MVALSRANNAFEKLPSKETEVNLCTLNELLRNNKNHWSTIIRRERDVRILRNVFKKKIRKHINYRHMSTFLISSEYISNVSNTVVVEEMDKLSKSLMSSRHNFELRRLKAGRKMGKLEDCFMDDNDYRTTINRIFDIFDLKTHIGPTNCENILEWVRKTLRKNDFHKLPEFVYKEAPIARSFRAKKVMQDVDPHLKRKVQVQIINNLRSGLCWWTIIAIRQIMTPVRVMLDFQNCWKYGYLRILKREMRNFKKHYNVHQLMNPLRIWRASRSKMSNLKFFVVNNKLRPILPGITENRNDNMKQKMHWKKVNSLCSWCLEKKGIRRKTIKDSCKVVSDFLKKNSDSEKVFAYTADISKCFAHLDHKVLKGILKNIFNLRCKHWITCVKGKDDRGFTQLIYCSADTKRQLYERVEKKMASKNVKKYTVMYTDRCASQWLVSELNSLLSSYYYKRNSKYFQIENGVPQGHPMSSLLSMMYLSDFEIKYWRKERKNPNIAYSRYEDDYIFITTQKELFEQMMKPLLTGRNTHKLQANLHKLKVTEDRGVLNWCGVRMDLKQRTFTRRRLCKDGVRRSISMKL